MQLVPRSYQFEAANSIPAYFQTKSGNPIVAMPTGTGKSVVIAMFLENVFRAYAGQRILVLTHVKELIQQNYMKLLALWPGAPAGINSAALGKRDFYESIIFAGIQSVAKYAARFGHVDLILVDECHLVSPNDETMYLTFIKALRAVNPYIKVVGFTATPWRLGHGKIYEDGGLFTDVCFDITGMEAFNRLIAEGYLCQLVPKRTNTVLDVSGVHMRGGEFIAAELQTAVDRREVTEAALKESFEIAHGRHKWLLFASGVHHAEEISQMMKYMGMECPAVTSDMSNGARDDIIKDLKSGRLKAAVNNNILTTGIDIPDIDYIGVLRPTASAVLWVQMLGRGTRPFSCPEWTKESCLVGDFAGNTARLGPINDPVLPRKKGKGGGDAPVRECPQCNAWNHASARFCGGKEPPNIQPGFCGYKFELHNKLKLTASTELLIKGDLPIVEVVPVNNITYQLHEKLDAPTSVKISYWCGPTSFSEYLCVEHEGYAAHKARKWWKERSTSEPPKDAVDALTRINECKVPTHIRVWVNKKYPEIMQYCYDGSAFGTQSGDTVEPPTIDVRMPRKVPTPEEVKNMLDDDIPF